MMRSLYTRLSLAFLLILAAVGGGFYLVDRWSTREYHEELTQRLNRSIAMYVTGQTTLIDHGVVNHAELKRLAERAMVINPSAEVYLLDRSGNVLAHGLPSDTVLLQRVDLAPVHALIDGATQMPVRGTDPRSPGREKVFSAAEVLSDGRSEGYLYVVLGGKQYDELADSIRASYVRQIGLGAVVALVLGGFAVGLLVFGLLTRRLTRLTAAVQEFADSRFDPACKPAVVRDGQDAARGRDEIGRLEAAFVAMARKIREQFEGLQKTDRLRRELISNISHDLRTPLTTMHAYVDTLLLKNDELSAEEREHYLRITSRHTRRLGALIGDLFELSKLDAGSTTLSLESFSLAELVHDIVQEFELEAKRRGVTISLQGAPGAALVHADIALMQRVLENLIRNALDYTPSGGKITLCIDPQPDQVLVAVSDTGCGIPPDQIGSIFERFYSSHNGLQSKSNSTGLGLAIVKRILDLHGSRITVDSQVDAGTRFEFKLPPAQAA